MLSIFAAGRNTKAPSPAATTRKPGGLTGRLTRAALVLGFAAAAFLAPKAHAAFRVANNYTTTVWVCFANFDSSACGGEGRDWRVRGWWKLEPGETKVVYGPNLLFQNKFYCYYAEAADGAKWEGSYPFHVNYDGSFESCYGFGVSTWEIRGFRDIRVPDLAMDYTLRLTP